MSIELEIPKKVADRFNACSKEAWDLPTEDWETFWDDVCTAMENRLKVLKQHAQES